MNVLIVTKSDDNESVSLVINAIREQGGQAKRFDTDRFPTSVQLIVQYNNGAEQLTLKSDLTDYDFSCLSVW